MALEITSPSFRDGQPIPSQFTCDGGDLSPRLKWTEVPPEAQSLALICDDPDAPNDPWVHWVVYNLPPTATGLPEGVEPDQELPDGTRQGLNGFGEIGYGGPCPPPGKRHRYFFKLYALASVPHLPAGASKNDLLAVMENRVLTVVQLMGTYQRARG